MAARKGLGVLGFSVGSFDELGPVMEAYKADIVNADPIGAFVNDNIMVTTGAFLDEDGKAAEKSLLDSHMTYCRATSSATTTPSPTPPRSRCGPS